MCGHGELAREHPVQISGTMPNHSGHIGKRTFEYLDACDRGTQHPVNTLLARLDHDVVHWNAPVDQPRQIGGLWWFPFPAKNQRVVLCCCEPLRVVDENGKEDPMDHSALSPW